MCLCLALGTVAICGRSYRKSLGVHTENTDADVQLGAIMPPGLPHRPDVPALLTPLLIHSCLQIKTLARLCYVR